MSSDMEEHHPEEMSQEEMSQEEMHSEEMPPPETQKTCKDLSVAALVLGIVSLAILVLEIAISMILYAGIAPGILAIIFGRTTLKDIDAGKISDTRRATALTGFILGIAGLGLGILNNVLTFALP